MAHAHTLPKTEPKPEFTDYTIASTPQGIIHAAIKRADYQQGIDYIRTTRSLKRMCRRTAINPRVTAQQATRGGYPKNRERDEDIASKRGVPHSKFLKRFKIVDRTTFSNALGEFIYTAKILVLHATRGWKVYA